MQKRMTRPRPDFYDSLDATLTHAWDMFARGPLDRRSATHAPTLVTYHPDLRPR